MRMLRLAAFSLLLLLPAVSRAESDLHGGPVQIDFHIDGSEHKAPLASGVMQLEPFQTSSFKASGTATTKMLDVELFARPQLDGTVAVELTVRDVEQDGRTIEWRPSLRGKRGVPLTATIQAGDVSRSVTLTVR